MTETGEILKGLGRAVLEADEKEAMARQKDLVVAIRAVGFRAKVCVGARRSRSGGLRRSAPRAGPITRLPRSPWRAPWSDAVAPDAFRDRSDLFRQHMSTFLKYPSKHPIGRPDM